jgi:dTDP-D-glucose 4,6-dehydratase
VVSNFVVQTPLGRDITVYGDGTQTRAFCYVKDLIDELIRLMKSQNEITGPINLGNPTEFTMLELAAHSNIAYYHLVDSLLPAKPGRWYEQAGVAYLARVSGSSKRCN